MAIERLSFPSPWSENLFYQELSNSISCCWVADRILPGRKSILAGYFCSWVVREEMHVLNVATNPKFRRQGVARMLFDHAIKYAEKRAVEQIILEVRPSNQAAQILYQSLSFRVRGIRKGYYRDTGEDALVMIKEMGRSDEHLSGSDHI